MRSIVTRETRRGVDEMGARSTRGFTRQNLPNLHGKKRERVLNECNLLSRTCLGCHWVWGLSRWAGVGQIP